MIRTVAPLALLLLLPLAGCLSPEESGTDARDAVRLAQGALPGWDVVYLAAYLPPDPPREPYAWGVGLARDGEVATAYIMREGLVHTSADPESLRVVEGRTVELAGPWSDGGAAFEPLGEGWRGLGALPDREGSWVVFLHGAEPRWERMRYDGDGNVTNEAFDGRTGEALEPLRGLSAREAVDRWRDAGGVGPVTGLSSVGYGSGFVPHEHRWPGGWRSGMAPLLVLPDAAFGDGRATQWLLSSGNATWRVDADGAVRLEDGLLDAGAPLEDWSDSPDVVGTVEHATGRLTLRAEEPGRPVWTFWSDAGDAAYTEAVDARPVPVLRLRGTVRESGPAEPPKWACGASLPVVEVDEAAKRVAYHDRLPVHPDHDLFVVDDVRIVMLDTSCHAPTLRSGNGTVVLPLGGLTVTTDDGVRVGDTLLRPGEGANVTVHWSVTGARYGTHGTWNYDGTVQATWLGDWPRGNVAPTLR